jgi:hypothetical protein
LEKEAKQREFFRSMEANIFKAMVKGVVPRVHVNGHGNSNSLTEDMDIVKPLPRNNLTSSREKIKKPTLIRTISSIDDEMIAELANDKVGNIDFPSQLSPAMSRSNAKSNFFEGIFDTESTVPYLLPALKKRKAGTASTPSVLRTSFPSLPTALAFANTTKALQI